MPVNNDIIERASYLSSWLQPNCVFFPVVKESLFRLLDRYQRCLSPETRTGLRHDPVFYSRHQYTGPRVEAGGRASLSVMEEKAERSSSPLPLHFQLAYTMIGIPGTELGKTRDVSQQCAMENVKAVKSGGL